VIDSRRWQLWGLLVVGVALSGARVAVGDEAKKPPNVVLITLESLRPDHVSFMTGKAKTTPNLDRLARESMVYDDAHSVTSWTLASHASLFTGLYPPAHQTRGPVDRLDDSYETIAEVLAGAGYQTAGVVSGPYLRPPHNLNQGFELYDDSASSAWQGTAHKDVTNPAMLEALQRFVTKQRDPKRPFFLFAYFWDPHYDYVPPAPWNERFKPPGAEAIDLSGYEENDHFHAGSSPQEKAYVLSQYDGEIAWTDATLGSFFELLKQRGLWDDTLIIITSDHGEEFFEHGDKGHKNNLFVESVHVPLIVKYPGGRPRGRDDRLVSLVDLFPTILQATGTESNAPRNGVSLRERAPSPDRPIFFDLYYVSFDEDEKSETPAIRKQWYAVRRGDLKLVSVSDRKLPYLFDVKADPAERHDLVWAPAHRASLQVLARTLEGWHRQMKGLAQRYEAGGAADLSEAARERLRALGYLSP